MAFGQTICGFDLLRVDGRSYVIDVNGWSFAKGSAVYEEMCAGLLRDMFLRVTQHAYISPSLTDSPAPGQWKLKTLVEVLRHADRTPKLKHKLILRPEILDDLEVFSRLQDGNEKLNLVYNVLNKWKEHDPQVMTAFEIVEIKRAIPSTKVQMRRSNSNGQFVLIIKWGGEITHSGRHQAQELGQAMRQDINLLNRALLGDIEIYSSVERRVQATADVFSKGLCKMAEVPQDLITVRPDLLDHASGAKPSLIAVKSRLSKEMVESVGNMLDELQSGLQEMRSNMIKATNVNLSGFTMCCAESPKLFCERWSKHFSDLLDAPSIDPARVSDLYDSLKFDILHNREMFNQILINDEKLLRTLFGHVQCLFAFLSPKETGMDGKEKLQVGRQISGPLLESILCDISTSMDSSQSPKARLYFTKESHMVALLNLVIHSGLPLSRRRTSSVLFPDTLTADPRWVGELDYLSQICFELFEKKASDGSVVYSLRIGMSQGAHDPHLLDRDLDRRHCLSVTSKKWITQYISAVDALSTLKRVLL